MERFQTAIMTMADDEDHSIKIDPNVLKVVDGLEKTFVENFARNFPREYKARFSTERAKDFFDRETSQCHIAVGSDFLDYFNRREVREANRDLVQSVRKAPSRTAIANIMLDAALSTRAEFGDLLTKTATIEVCESFFHNKLILNLVLVEFMFGLLRTPGDRTNSGIYLESQNEIIKPATDLIFDKQALSRHLHELLHWLSETTESSNAREFYNTALVNYDPHKGWNLSKTLLERECEAIRPFMNTYVDLTYNLVVDWCEIHGWPLHSAALDRISFAFFALYDSGAREVACYHIRKELKVHLSQYITTINLMTTDDRTKRTGRPRRGNRALKDPSKNATAEINRDTVQLKTRIRPEVDAVVQTALKTAPGLKKDWIERALVRQAAADGVEIPDGLLDLIADGDDTSPARKLA